MAQDIRKRCYGFIVAHKIAVREVIVTFLNCLTVAFGARGQEAVQRLTRDIGLGEVHVLSGLCKLYLFFGCEINDHSLSVGAVRLARQERSLE